MLTHLRNYASAGFITGLVGLVSFPILTRNLTVAEYGIVGLITASLTLFIAVGKLGIQHAVIRFFAQVKNGNSDYSMLQLNSTVSVVFFALATVTTTLWLISGIYVLPNIMQYENLPALFMVAGAIVFIRLMGSSALNFLRAQQRSGDAAIAESMARCLNLVFVLGLLFLSTLNPVAVISSLLVAEVFGVGYAFYCYSPHFKFSSSDVSSGLAKSMLIYGLPLMVLESLGLVLRLSDRYMIEAMLGASALGQYSASYNLAGYIDLMILVAMVQALKPAYMHMWESDGRENTQKLLSKFFRVYLITGIPFITMFSLVAPYLLQFLAGEKYAPGTVVIPYLAVSYLLTGGVHILTAGLYIFKDTKVLVIWSGVATVANLALNLIFIPKFGIIGASAVTIISFAIFGAGVSISAFKKVSFPIELRAPVLMTFASLIVYFLLSPMSFGSDIVNFVGKGLIGTLALLTTMWFTEPEVRDWIKSRLSKSVVR